MPLRGHAFAGLLCILVCSGAPASNASAQLTTLHDFCSVRLCHDGSQPSGPLLRDPTTGDLYGVTYSGGSALGGALYRLHQMNSRKWRVKLLHSFCSNVNCSDGRNPRGNLIMDTAGNLYGVTEHGGPLQDGVVYELSLENGGYHLTILHTFGVTPDGRLPVAGLTYAGAAFGALYDGISPLFGTTTVGSAPGHAGTIYMLANTGGIWNETVLYNFCSLKNCHDGSSPGSSLLMDSNGNLFGTTLEGGISHYRRQTEGYGVIFELSNPGAPAQSLIVLHSFCTQRPHCTDGSNYSYPFEISISDDIPNTNALTMDAQGNLFGAAPGGGAVKHGCCGVLFKIAADRSPSSYTVVYNFCTKFNCKDGANPNGELLIDSKGTIYGTTLTGGGHNIDAYNLGGGAAFRLSAAGLETLYAFCAVGSCLDGAYPGFGLASDGTTLFGTTILGGPNAINGSLGDGTLFEIAP